MISKETDVRLKGSHREKRFQAVLVRRAFLSEDISNFDLKFDILRGIGNDHLVVHQVVPNIHEVLIDKEKVQQRLVRLSALEPMQEQVEHLA